MWGAATFSCARCPNLCLTRSRIVDGHGPDHAPILAVGEAPGRQEDERGIPFVGMSGKLVRAVMAELGATAETVRYTNSVRCWMGDGNRNPTKQEIIACNGWLIAEILECAPKVILTLGKVAEGAVGMLEEVIRGELPQTIIVPAYHPAYLLRNPKLRPRWEDDLKRAILLAKVGPYAYQPRVGVVAAPWVEGEPDWGAEHLGIDSETDDGEEHWSAKLVTWQISDGTRARTYTGGSEWDFMIDLRTEFRRQWEEHGRPKLTLWNSKYDAPVLGLDLREFDKWEDAEIASYVLRKPAGLKNYATEYLGLPMHQIQELIGTGKKRIPYSQARREQFEKAEEYGNRDAVATSRAGEKLFEELAQTPSLERYYREIEKTTTAALLEMEQAGIRVDVDRLTRLSDSLDERIAISRAQLMSDFEVYKPNSTHELAIVMRRMGVILGERTEHGAPSLDKVAMGKYREQAEMEGNLGAVALIDAVMEYRKTTKVKSTYVDALLREKDWEDRIHCRFNQTVTDTNRLSSSKPNLQNIPAEAKMREIGAELRRSFVPAPGYVFVVGDYSQLELRIFAEYTQEPVLLEAFADPTKDVHQMVADEIRLSRDTTKILEYAIIYGCDKEKVAEVAGATNRTEAERILAVINSKVPSLLGWKKRIEEELRMKGFIESLFNWRVYYPLAFSPLSNERAAALREAANMPMQGTAAGIAKIAMREGYRLCQRYDSRLLLQVHDEMVWEVPEAAGVEFAEKMSVIGAECAKGTIGVPLVFACRAGYAWLDAKGGH